MMLIGCASADLITTSVTGKIAAPPNTVTITPPPAYTPWNLAFGSPNEITMGSIHVVANCNYTISIAGSTGGYLIGEQGAAMTFPTLKNPVLVWTGTTWAPTQSGNQTEVVIYQGQAGTVDIPLKLRQTLDASDADKTNPKIVFYFNSHIL